MQATKQSFLRPRVYDAGRRLDRSPRGCRGYPPGKWTDTPYSDFGLAGRLIKASIPLRSSLPYKTVATIPSRIIRNLAYQLGGPTRLHYRRLAPNYETYWVPDSDAVNSIDRYEMMLWFKSRGDECLNCAGISGSIITRSSDIPLIVRIHK
jgi:hypothetical protein